MQGFKKFLFRGNVVDLAVAVVIGAAFGNLITSFTRGFIDPLLALLGGKPNLDALTFKINDTVFPYGQFLTQLISFLITAAIVYLFVVKPLMHAMRSMGETTDEKTCPECQSAIPLTAARCLFCTSPQTDPNAHPPNPNPA